MKGIIAFGLVLLWAAPVFADYEAAARYSENYRGISFLVVQDGEVVFEDYPNGGGPDRPHALASGTKSFAGILAAAAVQDGLLDLDEPVSETITEWEGGPRETITIRQLLNLTDGLRHSGRVAQIPDYELAIAAPLQHDPGTVFDYHALPFQVFGEVMRRKLDGDPVEYLTTRVLDPIGLDVARWRRDRNGNPTMSAGAFLTARNWARLGEFVLAHGEWNGEPLVSRAAFDEIFVGSEANPAYGLSWWLNDPVDEEFASETEPLASQTDFWRQPTDFPDDMVFAAGLGNQRLFVSWERNMVVVRQAEGIMGALLGRGLSWSDAAFWRLIEAAPGADMEDVIGEEATPPQLRRQPRTVELPSGVILEMPVREEDDSEENDDGVEDEPDDDFVGPTF